MRPDDWTFATQANHCTDARILLGQGPPYTISATVCDNLGEFGQRLILGTANQGFGATDPTQVFLIEGQ